MLARSSGFDKAAQKGMTQLKANQKSLMKVSMQEREERSEGREQRTSRALSRRRRHKTLLRAAEPANSGTGLARRPGAALGKMLALLGRSGVRAP